VIAITQDQADLLRVLNAPSDLDDDEFVIPAEFIPAGMSEEEAFNAASALYDQLKAEVGEEHLRLLIDDRMVANT
jgi:hypothetical protein